MTQSHGKKRCCLWAMDYIALPVYWHWYLFPFTANRLVCVCPLLRHTAAWQRGYCSRVLVHIKDLWKAGNGAGSEFELWLQFREGSSPPLRPPPAVRGVAGGICTLTTAARPVGVADGWVGGLARTTSAGLRMSTRSVLLSRRQGGPLGPTRGGNPIFRRKRNW